MYDTIQTILSFLKEYYLVFGLIMSVIGGLVTKIFSFFSSRNKWKREEEEKIPYLTTYILKIETIGSLSRNLHEDSNILEFYYKSRTTDEVNSNNVRALKFRTLKYQELLERIAAEDLFLIKFNRLQEEHLYINYLFETTGVNWEFNHGLISKKDEFCLVCSREDVPKDLQGEIFGHSIDYSFEGYKSMKILADVNRFRKSK